jgi:hypothetical protein
MVSIIIFIYLQPDLITGLISLLACRSIAGTDYVVKNVKYKCFTDDYYLYSGVVVTPLLISLIIFMPTYLYYIIKKYGGSL